MRFYKKITGTIIFVLSTLGLSGQSFFANDQAPRFGLIDRDEGLMSLSVSSVQQDKYGFLWFGTQGGLHRFDGDRITLYSHDPFDENTLANDLVQTMYYEEETNTIWAGTYNGLTGMNIDTETFVHYSHDVGDGMSLSNNIVISITRGAEGDLWLGTMEGLNRFSRRDGVFTMIETAHSTIRALLPGSDGKIWIGSYGGLQYWDPETERIVTPSLELPSDFVMTLCEPEPGRILIGMWDGGVAEYWPDTNKLKLYDVPDGRIYSVLESTDGTIWAGSWGGGLWAKPLRKEPVWFEGSDTSELSNSIIYSLFEDKGGLVWVGTNGGGVHFLSPRRSNYRVASSGGSSKHSISEGKVKVITKDDEGNLYLSIYGKGINIIDGKTGEVARFEHDPEEPSSLQDNTVNAILTDSRGNWWIAHNGGLSLFDRETGSFSLWGRDIHRDLPLSHEIIYDVFEDSRGRLLIGTYGGGFDIYDPRDDSLVNFSHDPESGNSLSDNIVYDSIETSDGTLWISTNQGLNRMNPGTDEIVQYYYDKNDINSLSGDNVRQLCEDSRGRLWVATYSGGLNLYKPGNDGFIHYTTRDGLSSNNVLAIIEGDDGRIWISTRGGINIIDPETGEVDVIDERDGLFGVFFNYGHYKDDEGAVYFGGSHGVTKLDSHREYTNSHEPEVHITGLSLLGNSLGGEELVLDGNTYTFMPGKNLLSFEFVALDYESSGHNRFMYKMEGFDSDWVDNGNRSYASYTNLPPGKYTFHVKASNSDGIWNNEGALVNIIVLTPWYRTWGAFILYGIAAMILFYAVLRMRDAALLEKQNEKLEYSNNLLAKANSELESLTIHDSLTGLFNRRYFDDHLKDEILRARRAGFSLSLLMIDIDNFKRFNDSYGHLAGDRALEQTAETLRAAVARNTDFITRYGGEEFSIILFNTDGEGARRVADNIHRQIRSTPVNVNGVEYGLTVSIGIYGCIPDDSMDGKMYIKRADEALYRAKRTGRNRTSLYHPQS